MSDRRENRETERTEGKREGERQAGVGGKNIRLCLRSYNLNVGRGRARSTAGPTNLHPRSLSQRSSTASRIMHSKNTAAPLPRPRTAEHVHAPSPLTVGTLGLAQAALEQARAPVQPRVLWCENWTLLDRGNSYLSLYELSYFLDAQYCHPPLLCRDRLGRVPVAACPKRCS